MNKDILKQFNEVEMPVFINYGDEVYSMINRGYLRYTLDECNRVCYSLTKKGKKYLKSVDI